MEMSKTRLKKLMAILLALIMVLSLLPAAALADSGGFSAAWEPGNQAPPVDLTVEWVEGTSLTVYLPMGTTSGTMALTAPAGKTLTSLLPTGAYPPSALKDFSSLPIATILTETRQWKLLYKEEGKNKNVNFNYILQDARITGLQVGGSTLGLSSHENVNVAMSNFLGATIAGANIKVYIYSGNDTSTKVLIGEVTQDLPAGNSTVGVTCDMTGKGLDEGSYTLCAEAVFTYNSESLTRTGEQAVSLAVVLSSDTSWYNTSDTDFTLTSAEQLSGLAKIVNGSAAGIARDNFAGKTVRLNANIDLNALLENGAMPWMPIGYNEASAFAGTFDGRYHKIDNFYFGGDSSLSCAGLFGYLTGTVCNLGMESGRIELNARGIRAVGGIAGYNFGTIRNCYNKMNITTADCNQNSAEVSGGGGIAGACGKLLGLPGYIYDCYNSGSITALGCGGGIAGGLNKGIIAHSYNKGTVIVMQENLAQYTDGFAGGIVSQILSRDGIIYNCYNTATVSGKAGANTSGAIAGKKAQGGIVNCYTWSGAMDILAGDMTGGGYALTKSAMTSADFVTTINSGADYFRQDAGEQNGSYPILRWQTDQTDHPTYAITRNAVDSSNSYVTNVANIPSDAAEAGNTVVVKFTLSEGKGIADGDLAVSYNDGQSAVVTKVDKTTFTFTMPDASVTVSAVISDIGAVNTVTVTANGVADGICLVPPAGAQQFTAVAEGINDPAQTFTWTVSGNGSASTAIDENGLLTVGADEVPRILTVRAVSTVDISKSGELKIAVGTLWNGGGTGESPYELSSLDDLRLLGVLVGLGEDQAGQHFRVISDIDFSGAGTWEPIGSPSSPGIPPSLPFNGILDGEHHGFINIDIERETYAALFGCIGDNGVIKDLTIDGSVKNTAVASSFSMTSMASGLAFLNYGSITGCSVSGDISSVYGCATGFVTYNYGTIKDCRFDGTISTGEEDVALGAYGSGIATYNQGKINSDGKLAYTAIIDGCTVKGNISGSQCVGGIVAINRMDINSNGVSAELKRNAFITNCVNNADITDITVISEPTAWGDYCHAGGICGSVETGIITDCVNNGAINIPASAAPTDSEYTTTYAGGITGRYGSNVEISGCTNNADISAPFTTVGGILGIGSSQDTQYHVKLSDLTNNGDVRSIYEGSGPSSTVFVGGIIGNSRIVNTEAIRLGNNGAVSASPENSWVGGLMGSACNGTYSDSYNNGSVSGMYSGGIMGVLLNSLGRKHVGIENCYNIGSVQTSGEDGVAAGIVGVRSPAIYTQYTGDTSFTQTIRNNYNAGALSGIAVGGIVGGKSSNDEDEEGWVTIQRNYYLAGTGDATDEDGFMTKTAEQLKSAEFLALLNENSQEGQEPFKAGAGHYKDGYPLLSWETVPDDPGDNGGDPGDNGGDPGDNGNDPGDNGNDPGDNGGGPGDNGGGPGNNGGGSGGQIVQKPQIEASEGGKTALSEDGTTLIITPDKGYTVKDVVVNGVSKGAVTSLTGLKTGDKVEIVYEKTPAPAPTVAFEDVTQGSWYADAVTAVVIRGLFKGVSETEFAPENRMNRAMFVTVLGRLYEFNGKTIAAGESSPFQDVAAGSYYAGYVGWAAANGLVQGIDKNSFGTESDVTRAQMAVFLYRYAKLIGLNTEAGGALGGFSDASDVPAWAAEAMSWAVSAGLINGIGENMLDPGGSATRAQVAVIFDRFCKMIES